MTERYRETQMIDEQFLRHWTSDNKGQCLETDEVSPAIVPDYCLKRVARPWCKEEMLRQCPETL